MFFKHYLFSRQCYQLPILAWVSINLGLKLPPAWQFQNPNTLIGVSTSLSLVWCNNMEYQQQFLIDISFYLAQFVTNFLVIGQIMSWVYRYLNYLHKNYRCIYSVNTYEIIKMHGVCMKSQNFMCQAALLQPLLKSYHMIIYIILLNESHFHT